MSVNCGTRVLTFTSDATRVGSTVEIVTEVPFDQPLGRVSTTQHTHETEDGRFRLLAVFLPAGAAGEVVSANYTLSLIE